MRLHELHTMIDISSYINPCRVLPHSKSWKCAKLLDIIMSSIQAWVIFSLIGLCQIVQAEMDEEDMYPIIFNTQADTALLILPEKGCHVIVDTRSHSAFLLRNKLHVYNTDGHTMNELIGLCRNYQNYRINASQFIVGLREKALLIYPGTHFCGAGNNAENFTDLGYFTETDKCCREHDFCTNFIDGWDCHPTIPYLCNRTPFTRSHCSCDEKFRSCLQKANDTASLHIGILYFTVFGLKCFREDYPISECAEYGGFLNIHCQKYSFDLSQEKTYQFFDSPRYSRGEIVEITPADYSRSLHNHKLYSAGSIANSSVLHKSHKLL